MYLMLVQDKKGRMVAEARTPATVEKKIAKQELAKKAIEILVAKFPEIKAVIESESGVDMQQLVASGISSGSNSAAASSSGSSLTPLPAPQIREDGLRNLDELKRSIMLRFGREPEIEVLEISSNPHLFQTKVVVSVNNEEYISLGTASTKKIATCAATARWYELYQIEGSIIKKLSSKDDEWKQALHFKGNRYAPTPAGTSQQVDGSTSTSLLQNEGNEKEPMKMEPVPELYKLCIKMKNATPWFEFVEVTSSQEFFCTLTVRSPFSQRIFIKKTAVGNCKAQAKMLAVLPVLEELKRHFQLYTENISITEDLFDKFNKELIVMDESLEEQEVYDVDEDKNARSLLYEALTLLYPGETMGRIVKDREPTTLQSSLGKVTSSHQMFEAFLWIDEFKTSGVGFSKADACDHAAEKMLDILKECGKFPVKVKMNERFNLLPVPQRSAYFKKLFREWFRIGPIDKQSMELRGVPSSIIHKTHMCSFYPQLKLPFEKFDKRLPGITEIDGALVTIGPRGIAIPCFDHTGKHIIAAQIRTTGSTKNKYLWMSSTKVGGCPPHLDNNNVPLYVWNNNWLYSEIKNPRAEIAHYDAPIYEYMRSLLKTHRHVVGISEGGIKSLLASLRLQLSIIGFANSFQVSKDILKNALEYFLPSTDGLIVWFLDHAFDMNPGVCLTCFRSLDALFELGYKNIKFMWWEQTLQNQNSKDIDDLEKMQTRAPPSSFVKLITIPELLTKIEPKIVEDLHLRKRWMGVERMQKYKKL